MYVFGFDMALDVVMGIGLVLHLIEFVLAVAILRKLGRRANA